MGRFGNVMLINGDLELSAEAAVGEVVRLYVVNTANTRIFKFGLNGARMKLVGGDSGRCERESLRRHRAARAIGTRRARRAVRDARRCSPGASHP